MKKVILFFILGLLSIANAHAVVTQVGTVPGGLIYTYNTGEDVRAITLSSKGTYRVYDRAGLLIGTYGSDWSAGGSFASVKGSFESERYIYLVQSLRRYYNVIGSSNDYFYKASILIYDKTTDTFIYRAIGSGSGSSNSGFSVNARVEGDYLVLGGSRLGTIPLNMLDDSLNGDYIPPVSAPGTLVNVSSSYWYRVSLNNINYLDESNKEYAFLLQDNQGDFIEIRNQFISPDTFRGYTYLYNTDTANIALSIYSEDITTGDLDLRRYAEYTGNGSIYGDDEFYLYQNTSGLVGVGLPDATYDYTYGLHQLYYFPLNIAGDEVLYFYNTSGQIMKEADFTLPITPFPGTGGGTGGTGTGSIDYDDEIWNWDVDGDGDVEFLNGEIFIGIGNFFKYLFNKLISFFENIKNLIEKLGEIFTIEEKTFSFNLIGTVNATENISSIINNNVDDVGYKSTVLGKIDVFIKGFIAFISIVIGLAVFISLNKNTGGGSTYVQNTQAPPKPPKQ